jgi:UDP-N-acetylglucosamine 2-epimerase (non-hydrolysing)
MKKILIVFGTRPEAIKMAPLVLELKKRTEDFEVSICVTGQHREMLDQVLTLFDIRPDYDLNIMSKGQDLYDVSSRVLLGMRDILKSSKPDIVMVHGDTSTSTFTSIASFYERIAVAHVEAGLRTQNMYSPWPEEINRQITARITSFHFSPTKKNQENLLKEGISADKVWITGNTVIDALFLIREKLHLNGELRDLAKNELLKKGYDQERKQQGRKIILVTGHRRENFGEGFEQICRALKKIAFSYPDVDIVYPVHLNPNVRITVEKTLSNLKNVFLIEPLDYLPFVYMMTESFIILTDSGGVQEEAPSLGVPVLVMRDTTERPEALETGGVKLVGTKEEVIFDAVSELLMEPDSYKQMSLAVNPYGDGKTAKRIVDLLKNAI